MRFILCILFICSFSLAKAQIASIDSKVDSTIHALQSQGIDSIIVYSKYSIGFDIPSSQVDCMTDKKSSISISECSLIYSRNVKCFVLKFKCDQEPQRNEMQNCQCIAYSFSLASILDRKDQFIKGQIKANHFLPPYLSHDEVERVTIVTKNKKRSFEIRKDMMTSNYPIWKKYFWIDPEIHLVELIRKDIQKIK